MPFDLLKERRQRGVVGGVPRHYLVGQREALRRDDQRDHHLHAVGPLVPAAAETALAFERRIALEIGRGQVVKQHVEARVEQRRPPAAQIREEVLLVRRQLVEAAIERVVGDRPVAAKEIAQRAVLVPVAVKTPLAARVDQPVAGEDLQDVEPPRALPARRQALTPETVQVQPVPQDQGQPARPPTARIVQRHLRDVDLDHLAGQLRRLAILGKQRHLPRPRLALHHINRAAPRRTLAVVDLAQIEDLTLISPAATDPDVLHHTPIAVLLAVLEASFAAHEHGQSVRCFASTIKGVGRHYTRFWKAKARKSDTFRAEKSSN